jgi:hypothetical protein
MSQIIQLINEGYIYCFSNPTISFNDKPLYKIGYTIRDIECRRKELSKHSGVADEYIIEFAIKVKNPKKIENIIHLLLEDYRHNKQREFFNCDLLMIRKIFDGIPDSKWLVLDEVINELNNDDSEDDEDDGDDDADEGDDDSKSNSTMCREPQKCFKHEQTIRHTILLLSGKYDTWIATYNADENNFKYSYNGNDYKTSLNTFTRTHYLTMRPDRTTMNNAWKECECLRDDKWVSTYNLPIIS